jgi:general secretion pathway protein G
MRNKKGFTLVEMLLVVIIISILAAMVVPRFTGRSEEAKIAAATADVRANLSGALDLYELDNGRYPTTEQGLDALAREPSADPRPRQWKGPYLKQQKALSDPWGNVYQYRSPGARNNSGYDLHSFGPDGADGGNDDIGNWDDKK